MYCYCSVCVHLPNWPSLLSPHEMVALSLLQLLHRGDIVIQTPESLQKDYSRIVGHKFGIGRQRSVGYLDCLDGTDLL